MWRCDFHKSEQHSLAQTHTLTRSPKLTSDHTDFVQLLNGRTTTTKSTLFSKHSSNTTKLKLLWVGRWRKGGGWEMKNVMRQLALLAYLPVRSCGQSVLVLELLVMVLASMVYVLKLATCTDTPMCTRIQRSHTPYCGTLLAPSARTHTTKQSIMHTNTTPKHHTHTQHTTTISERQARR